MQQMALNQPLGPGERRELREHITQGEGKRRRFGDFKNKAMV